MGRTNLSFVTRMLYVQAHHVSGSVGHTQWPGSSELSGDSRSVTEVWQVGMDLAPGLVTKHLLSPLQVLSSLYFLGMVVLPGADHQGHFDTLTLSFVCVLWRLQRPLWWPSFPEGT